VHAWRANIRKDGFIFRLTGCAIVNDDDLDISERLIKHGLERLTEQEWTVAGRNDN
jgi:hypothetical protein